MPNSSGHDFVYPEGVCTNEACANQWCPGIVSRETPVGSGPVATVQPICLPGLV